MKNKKNSATAGASPTHSEANSSTKSTLTAKRTPNVSELGTSQEVTWCPGCPNHMILAAVKQTITNIITPPNNSSDQQSDRQAKRPTSEATDKLLQKDFVITTDIGCHAKIFDYLNLSGIYCLHGRSIPTAIGIKLGNPNLKVLTFAGDGAAYSEGMSHFIHAFKHNADITLILHDNQSFSLTTGQPTPTSQQGYISKASPLGTFTKPFNPIKLALASNATFVARTNARDIPHMVETFTKAIAHKGFSFVEVIQDCLIFNIEANGKDKLMYKIKDNTDVKTAEKLADEFDYNSKSGKIPIGIIYQSNEKSLEEKWPQLIKQMNKE
ncbi:MAG: 2-oxoacid:ferredoxin oxidoreductase subunit beta [Nanoarchaeota archaeon]|nr:2-oxoacid:ferredoxin oxidoreductase subunit beta [Nanoarchaeota archaeon]